MAFSATQFTQQTQALGQRSKTFKSMNDDEAALVKEIKERTKTLIYRMERHDINEGYKQSVNELHDLANNFLNKKRDEEIGKDKCSPSVGDELDSKFRWKHKALVTSLTILKNIREPDKKTRLPVMDYAHRETKEVEVNIATDKLGDLKKAAEKAFCRGIKKINFNGETDSGKHLRKIVSINNNAIPYFTC